MNIIQDSSEFGVSCATNMRRAVTLKADKELKRSATKDESDWSYGEANCEELEPLFQSSAIASNSSSPPTTSLIIEQQVSGILEKADISDSVSEMLGLRGVSSK